MENCKPSYTPLDPGIKLRKCADSSCKKHEPSSYQSLVGALMYLAVSTRPDIVHTINKLSQFNSDPHAEHAVALKHLLRYLSTNCKAKLTYTKSSEDVKGYVDADWAGNPDNRKSCTGLVFIFAGAAVSWESKKQTSVALSSTEAEYMALSQASKEAVYLRNLVIELGITLHNNSIVLFNDNVGAQQLAKNPVHHPRTKHIDIRYHFVRELIEEGVITTNYLCTGDMIADIFTKNVTKAKHIRFTSMMGLSIQ